ncbi:hypothetical protein C8A05DRAFT_38371 [Staphylotrichum tortipilum]|uniref:Early meiotic induction protein 1 n=1 Tax=Staphylotrichum tortipilum TaxID=2831512 RepID=A0AAN6MDH9_9PEZI|nr:hypothetical protein C8A05DRAFT_38371 [Staphylotrichum longicolle]
MGWFWQSPSPATPTGTSGSLAASVSSQAPPATAAGPTQTPLAAAEAAPADREIAMFIEMLAKDTQSPSQRRAEAQQQQPVSPSPSQPEPTSSSSSSPWLPWSSSKKASDSPAAAATTTDHQPAAAHPPQTRSPQSLAMSEHSLPTSMSCRDAFDYAWHCHTPGSQWNAVYRYGGVRPCTELWDDFWFCMRTKSYPPDLRAEAVREHYRAKEEAKYGGRRPSSEDVWQSRDERAAPGTAFQASFDPPIVDDAEFQRRDAEERRRRRAANEIATAQAKQ